MGHPDKGPSWKLKFCYDKDFHTSQNSTLHCSEILLYMTTMLSGNKINIHIVLLQ